MGKIFKWIGIAFVGLIALAILGAIVAPEQTPEQKAATQAERDQKKAAEAQATAEKARQEAASMPTVTSQQYAKAYEDNTVAADQQFKGKKFKVSGTVTDINTGITGNPVLVLRGANEFMQPQFEFDKSALNDMAKLKKGNKVTLMCTGRGDVAKMAFASDCTML